MARGRMINRTLMSSRRFRGLSWRAKALYCGVYAFADRDGLLTGDLEELWATTGAALHTTLDEFREVAAEVLATGLWVELRCVLGRPVIRVDKFRENQAGMPYTKEAKSEWTLPVSADGDGTCDSLRSNSGVGPELVRSHSGVTPSEEKRRGAQARRKPRTRHPTNGEISAAGGRDAFYRDTLQGNEVLKDKPRSRSGKARRNAPKGQDSHGGDPNHEGPAGERGAGVARRAADPGR